MRIFITPVLFLALSLAGAPPANAQIEASHPLDAMTAAEFWTTYDAIRDSGEIDKETHFVGVNLIEPPKSTVLAWTPGKAMRRESLAIVKKGSQVFEAVVDLGSKKLRSWTEVKGVYPNGTWAGAGALAGVIKKDPAWLEAMKRRGITDLRTIGCYGYVFGYFDLPEERGRRLARATCHDRHGSWRGDAKPVEGVVILIDVEKNEVVRVIDGDVVPIPRSTTDHDPATIGPPREVPSPILVQQPAGPGFEVDGTQVSWQNWRFHFRIDPRMGVVISRVMVADGERLRSILYKGSLSEVYVPYQDPSEGWYYVTYLDVGEYTYGFAQALERGTDCPDHAVFFDGVYADGRGMPFRSPNTACLFEREAGDIAWRHYDGAGVIESRPRRDLVLRMIANLGNYDYIIDWVFLQDGTIQVVAGATGIVTVKAVKEKTADATRADADDDVPDAYGRFVDENLVAVNHDHFLSFRLDLDVDGTKNSFVLDRLVPKRLGNDSPRKSIWQREPRTLKSEKEARLDIRLDRPSLWRVVNPKKRGRLGYPTSYQIKPGATAISLLDPDDNPQARAAFSKHALWVTRYAEGEEFAAGDYVYGSKGGGGLPAWTQADRDLENQDLVVWYTVGMHHQVRAEDWPVMPTASHSFDIRPFDFFDRNPALDLPK